MCSEGYGSCCSDWGWLKASLPSENACFTALLASSPDICSRALALSTAIPHAGDLLFPLHPWVSICWALNFTLAYDTGWICGHSRTRFSSQSVMLLPTHSGMGMGIESSDTMHYKMQSSQLHSCVQQPASFSTLLKRGQPAAQ